MFETEFLKNVALVASVAMPFFNIPLIMRMIKRKSSEDLSLTWLLGVYGCIVLMLPYGLMTPDVVLKAFSIVNVTLFGAVVAVAVFLRFPRK